MTRWVIGLTGGIGSGKSTVAALFAQHHITVIDTDQIARDITQSNTPAYHKIVEKFGDSILQQKQLNRSRLRELIFADAEKRQWLENLLHPLIRQEIQHQVAAATSPYCIVVIPLLFETSPNPLISRVLVVDAPESLQIQRATSRDGIRAEQVQAIMNTQLSRAERLARADDVIENDGSLEELKNKVNVLHEEYLKKLKDKI